MKEMNCFAFVFKGETSYSKSRIEECEISSTLAVARLGLQEATHMGASLCVCVCVCVCGCVCSCVCVFVC